MATFLDFSLLSGASSIFAFLLIFCLVYALLSFTKIFGISNGLSSMVAFTMAVLGVMSPPVVRVIEVVTPWYTLMMIVIVLILLVVMIFGGLGNNIDDIKKNMGGEAGYYKIVIIFIVVISIIIFFSGLGYVFLSGEDSEFSLNRDGVYVDSDGNPVNPNVVAASGEDVSAGGSGLGDVGGKGVGTFLESLFHPKVIGMIMFLLLAAITVLLMGYAK